jgi:hypothetical protein
MLLQIFLLVISCFIGNISTRPTEPATGNSSLSDRYQYKTINRKSRASLNDYSRLITTKSSNLTLHELTNNKSVDLIKILTNISTNTSKPIEFSKDLTVPPSFLKHNADEVYTEGTIQNILRLNNWSNLDLDPVTLEKPKKAIHKIFTKWSDNPQDILPQGENHPEKYQLLYSSDANSSYLNALVPTKVVYSPIIPPELNNKVKIYDKKNDPNPPFKYNSYKKDEKCAPVRIYLNNTLKNNNKPKRPETKENCNNEVDIQILSELNNNNSEFDDEFDDKFDIPIDADKLQVTQNDDGFSSGSSVISNLNPIPILTSLSQLGTSGGFGQSQSQSSGGTKKHPKKEKKKKKKKKGGSEEGVLGTGMSVSTIMSTIISYLVLFNPLNFGIFGLVNSPMMATLTVGICIAMYKFMSSNHSPPARPITVRKKVKHLPIHHIHHHEPVPILKPHYHHEPDWERSHETKKVKPPDYYIDWVGPSRSRSKTKNYKFKLL